MAETATTYRYSGALQSYVVPDGCHVVNVVVAGGEGTAGTYGGTSVAALGGLVSGDLTVTPGETLDVAVGASGATSRVEGSLTVTPNGASVGRGGQGAGASSHVARGSTRLIVAGGGGGGTSAAGGGLGGGAIGGTGRGLGLEGKGGGADPAWASSDGESPAGGGGGGGGWVGGRAGVPNTIEAHPAGGGGSGKAPAGGASSVGVNSGPGSVTITAGLAPYAPAWVSPAAGSTVDFNSVLVLSWTFRGWSGLDSQSACEVASGDGQVWEGGSDQSLTLPAQSLALGARTVRVRTANQFGTWGDWGPWLSLPVGVAPPAPVITSPVDGSTITGTRLLVAWTATGQTAWDVRRVADNGGSIGAAVYTDTGTQPGGTASTDLTLDVNGRYEHAVVRYQDATGLWSQASSVRYHVAWDRPPIPSAVAVATTTVTGAPAGQTDAIDITITNPVGVAGHPDADHNNVLAGPPGGPFPRVNPNPIPPNTVWRWDLPPGGVDHVVLVQPVAPSGATAVTVAAGSPLAGYGLGPYGTSPYGE